MYVSIGENEIVKTKEIIGLLDVQCLKQSRQNLRLLNMLKEQKRAIKTIIIIQKNGKIQECFSILSTRTLKERLTKFR